MNASPAPDLILWMDVETTGLDVSREYLLQVAALVTDPQGRRVSEDTFDEVVLYAPEEAQRLRADSIPLVQAMHDATSLWERLPQGKPLAQVDALLEEFLKAHAPEKSQARLGGNSVRLDANFADRYLPRTAAHLHYRLVDVSTLAWVTAAQGLTPPEFPKKKTHDALDDIQESLEEYRWILEHLKTPRVL